jgi:3-oxoadipate enol-lactonase
MRPSSSGSEPAALRWRADGPAGAPVVVLGASMGTTGSMWARQLPALAERWRVVRYEHRGHGGSPAPAGPYRLDELGRDVLGVIDQLGGGPVAYAGVSLGGMVGMWLAANHPERVARLALVCTSAYLPPASGWTDRAATARSQGTGALAPVVVGRWFTPPFAADHPEVVAEFTDGIAGVDDEGYAGCCEAIAAMDLREQLGRIQAPTLVLAGADDPSAPPEHAEVIGGGVRGARVEVLDRAAHLAAVERPEAVTRLLVDHLTA